MKIIYIKPCRVSIEYCLKFKEKVIINWVLEENPTRYGISCHCTSNHSIYDLKHHQHFFYKLYSFQGTHYAVFNFHIMCDQSCRSFLSFHKTSSFVSKGSCNLYFGVMVIYITKFVEKTNLPCMTYDFFNFMVFDWFHKNLFKEFFNPEIAIVGLY